LTIDVEITLAPCTKAIYSEFYRVVLDEIISKWSKSGVGVSQYDLYTSSKQIRSKGRLNRAIKDLSACGYIVCILGEAKTKSPYGRKECYPTPLGILVHSQTSLLGYKIVDADTRLAMYVTYNELEALILQHLPHIYRYMDYVERVHQVTLYPDLDRGYATVIHALSMLRINLLRPLRTPTLQSRLPKSHVKRLAKVLQLTEKELKKELERCVDDLEIHLNYLDMQIEELEEELDKTREVPYVEGMEDIHDLVGEYLPELREDHTAGFSKQLKELYNRVAEIFRLMLKTLEVHEKLLG